MTKILAFPQKTDSNFPASTEEAQSQITAIRQSYCDEVASDALDATTTVLMNYGIQVRPNGSAIKDLIFLEEAIKAVLYRNKNVPHPFHDMIEKAIVLPDEMESKIEAAILESTLT